MAWPDSGQCCPGVGTGGVPQAAAGTELLGSVRLQFSGGQRLGGCVAWDCTSGLLAAELQHDTAADGDEWSGAGHADGCSIQVAIIDPQAPQSHCVAHVPAAAPSDRLAALAWSPQGCRRMLLTVTAAGRAYAWSMDPPPAAVNESGASIGSTRSNISAAATGALARAGSAAAPGAGPAARGAGHVPCVNVWYGWHAFDLPLKQQQAASAPDADISLSFLADAPGEESAGGDAHRGEAQQQRLVCCRFLESPRGGAAAWDVAGAPPFLDRPAEMSEVVSYYRSRGLEGALAAQSSASTPSGGLHWVRPGLLCFAAVTSRGQLWLACSARGAGAGAVAGDSWVLAPAVQLPGLAGAQLAHADVAAAGCSGSLLVAASTAAAAGAAQQTLLFEVAGPPPPLAGPRGTGQPLSQQQQPQQVARLEVPPSLAAPGAATLSLAFLPGQADGGSTKLLLVSGSSGGTGAVVATCAAGERSGGSGTGALHSWQVRAGGAVSLAQEQLAMAAVASCQDGVCAAVALPEQRAVACLASQPGSDASGASVCFLRQTSIAAGLHSPPPASPGAAAVLANGSAAPAQGNSRQRHQEQGQRSTGLAVSPNGLYAAVAVPGSSALVLAPLLAQPVRGHEVEPFMLQLGKRCCYCLLTARSSAGWWDVTAAVQAACRRWGHHHLEALQQLVDAAVLSARQESRPRLVIAWARLKAALLAAAAAVHPAAAADLTAAAVQADTAAREWVTTAADVFDQHLPDPAALKAAAAKGAAALSAEHRAALVKMLPARNWALWAANFSLYYARCLQAWVDAKQREQQGGGPVWSEPPGSSGGGGPAGSGAAHKLAAEHAASADCVPCIRLLSDQQFYRAFGRLVSGVHQLTRTLNQLQRTKQPSTLLLMLQQLQQLQETAVLLKLLHEAFTKTKAAVEGGGAGGGAANGGAAAAGSNPRYAGAWTFVSAPPAPALTWSSVAAALSQLRQQQGGSALLSRVQPQGGAEGGGRGGDSPQALLQAAVPLGLLPAAVAAGCAGDGGSAALASLLQQRDAAMAAAEAEEGLLIGAPALPRACALDAALWGPGGGDSWHGREGGRVQRRWQAERSAALGLPPWAADSDDPAAFEECRDVLTGRVLSWEHPVTYSAADGSCVTAELQPEAWAPGSINAWQPAYAAAAPAGAQPWKRLRAA